jgi:NitT/TauT family transport system ATP-binding protein
VTNASTILPVTSAAIEFRQVTLHFPGAPRPAVVDCSFSVPPGEFLALVGPSGCGKSTVLRLIAGLLAPTQGSVLVVAPRAGRTSPGSFVFQHPTLLPWRTVLGNVALPLQFAGTGAAQARSEAASACRLVGLQGADLTKLPRMLSGGMQMRVSLARALVTHPQWMLLDEPFAAIDDLLRQQLNDEVLQLWGQQHWTAVFVTHHLYEAVFMAQRVLIMSAAPGRILGEVRVPFSYPRAPGLRTTVEFARCVEQVDRALRGGTP